MWFEDLLTHLVWFSVDRVSPAGSLTPDAFLVADVEPARYYHWSVATGGDTDGDGAGDLAVTFVQGDGASEIHVVPGPLEPFQWIDDETRVVTGPAAAMVGYDISFAPDWDGDGRDELLADTRAYPGAVFLLDTAAIAEGTAGYDDTLLEGNDDTQVGTFVRGGGDYDADGRDDVLVGTPDSILLVTGGDAWPRSPDDVTVQVGLYAYDGRSLGDTDGDGYEDLGVRSESIAGAGDSMAAVFRGPLTGPVAVEEASLVLRAPEGEFWFSDPPVISELGDVDADGRADWLFGGSQVEGAQPIDPAQYRVHLVHGGLCGTMVLDETMPHIASPTHGDSFGSALVPMGDLDDDGLPDFAVGSTGTLVGDTLYDVLVFGGAVF